VEAGGVDRADDVPGAVAAADESRPDSGAIQRARAP
jgi:hypothetical protein